jgi:excisionase family DNA binding protein
MTTQILLTPLEAGEILRLPSRRVVRLAKAGEIPHVCLPSGEVRFIESELWAWARSGGQAAEGLPA